jgi:hypothetical protein
MPVAPPRYLHVANGHCTTRLIHQAGIPGTSSIWADPLHEGPVPGAISDQQLLEIRARHLAPTPATVAETMAGLQGWRSVIDDHAAYDELILWYEHDLFDQLNLIQVLSRLGPTHPSFGKTSLICIGSFPGRPDFKGLGELTPGELATLFDTRRPVSDAQCAIAARAWLAFSAADPRQIEDLLRDDTSALPFLAAALQRHLEEFPSATNGLSRSEQRVMELTETGPVDPWKVFPLMHRFESAFYIADSAFWHVVEALASTSPPLIALDVTSAQEGQLPHGTMALTDAGREVLRGTVDRVRRYGLMRWLGGVHLEGTSAMWRWDAAGRRLVKA